MIDGLDGQGPGDGILGEAEAEKGGEQEIATSEFYTPEEIESVLAENGTLDANRLSPEGKLLQKSFERGFTKKFEEVSELSKTLKDTIKPSQKDPLEMGVEFYTNDPVGFVSFARGRIKGFKDVYDPLADNRKEIENGITWWEDHIEAVKETAKERSDVYTKTLAIPEEIRRFAKGEGYADKELLSPKILKAVTALYKAEEATKKLSHLAKKKDPSEVTKPGSGTQASNGKEKSMEELFYGNSK